MTQNSDQRINLRQVVNSMEELAGDCSEMEWLAMRINMVLSLLFRRSTFDYGDVLDLMCELWHSADDSSDGYDDSEDECEYGIEDERKDIL